MRKILLMSSALVVSGLLSGVAEAACIQTPTCSSLGYTSSSSCDGGIKCPFGNAWNCTIINNITEVTNKITEIINKITIIEEKITEIEENGGGNGTINYDCKIGNIVYSDKTCSSEPIEGKISIGVIFNEGNRLAIAKNTETRWWSENDFTGGSCQGSDEALGDWAGKYNTKRDWEVCLSQSRDCPAFKYAASYYTEGTEAGDWYLPALAELNAIYKNKDVLNETLAKIGGKQLPSDSHWSSSANCSTEAGYRHAWGLLFREGRIVSEHRAYSHYVRPVLAF